MPLTCPRGRSANWNTVGRNCKSVTMDCGAGGLEAFYRLVSKSDIFIENNRPTSCTT